MCVTSAYVCVYPCMCVGVIMFLVVSCSDQGSGFCVTGKIEAGYIQTGERMLAMPPNQRLMGMSPPALSGPPKLYPKVYTDTHTHTHTHSHAHVEGKVHQ